MGSKNDIHPVDPTRQLPGSEVADILKQIASRHIEFEFAKPEVPWDSDNPGNHTVRAGGYDIALFNDNGTVDYVDKAMSPDGRKGSYGFWIDREQEPLALLTADEIKALDNVLSSYQHRSSKRKGPRTTP